MKTFIVCLALAIPASAFAQTQTQTQAENSVNYCFWSYYEAYVSLVEGAGSYETFYSAYWAYYSAEQALLSETPEGTQEWIASAAFMAGNAAWYAYLDYVYNPSDSTWDAMWYAYNAMWSVQW